LQWPSAVVSGVWTPRGSCLIFSHLFALGVVRAWWACVLRSPASSPPLYRSHCECPLIGEKTSSKQWLLYMIVTSFTSWSLIRWINMHYEQWHKIFIIQPIFIHCLSLITQIFNYAVTEAGDFWQLGHRCPLPWLTLWWAGNFLFCSGVEKCETHIIYDFIHN
jgi:hypothetical protein